MKEGGEQEMANQNLLIAEICKKNKHFLMYLTSMIKWSGCKKILQGDKNLKKQPEIYMTIGILLRSFSFLCLS